MVEPLEDPEPDLALAVRLADAADALTSARFRATDLAVATKPDLTPVTEADTAVERAVRDLIGRERPDDAVLGEELGGEAVRHGRQWVVDPIDGTKNFVRGHPVWASLVALLVDGEPRAAVVTAPALGRRWWASAGGGTWTTGPLDPQPRRCRVSAVGELGDAYLGYASLGGWGGRRAGLDRLLAAVWRTRAFGDFWSYCLLAEGALDVALEPEVSLWDLAAPALLVTEAGGRFGSLDGTPGPGGGSALASNGALHDAALAALG